MKNKELIESGNLELYVFGLLSETETAEVAKIASEDDEVNKEIVSIEKSVIALSSSFAPSLSAENYNRIKQKLNIETKVVQFKPKSNISQYIGWMAAAVFLLGCGYLFNLQQNGVSEIDELLNQKSALEQTVSAKEKLNNQINTSYSVIKDENNVVVKLAGQAISPTSSAKVYWNNKTNKVFIDASSLPTPPDGMVYQVWSLKLAPTLTPTSIGLIDNAEDKMKYLIEVDGTVGAEGFGITLEPAGGSKTPTMEQLYTLGKV
ncbi:anti-sigma factor [Flavobacterium difficile]|uniref:Anti-sigma factor n=1 Tax=Flavobacterium difficile TaxID=2709659 RepID=A0ABX0I4W7_9FLAO|nr:anti-sigma factor [Flavobacterium difficile]NHM01766.1 anti-sigma factor [Flavobacterium difficile]